VRIARIVTCSREPQQSLSALRSLRQYHAATNGGVTVSSWLKNPSDWRQRNLRSVTIKVQVIREKSSHQIMLIPYAN
jgi:hypothetical protein